MAGEPREHKLDRLLYRPGFNAIRPSLFNGLSLQTYLVHHALWRQHTTTYHLRRSVIRWYGALQLWSLHVCEIPLHRHLKTPSLCIDIWGFGANKNSVSTVVNRKHPSDSQISLRIGPQSFLPVDTAFSTTSRTDNRHFPTTSISFCSAQLYRPVENRYNVRPYLRQYTVRGHTVRRWVYKWSPRVFYINISRTNPYDEYRRAGRLNR